MSQPNEETHDNVRQFMSHLIGQTIVDITQDDPEERAAGDEYVMLLLSGGDYLKFPTGKGFSLSVNGG